MHTKAVIAVALALALTSPAFAAENNGDGGPFDAGDFHGSSFGDGDHQGGGFRRDGYEEGGFGFRNSGRNTGLGSYGRYPFGY